MWKLEYKNLDLQSVPVFAIIHIKTKKRRKTPLLNIEINKILENIKVLNLQSVPLFARETAIIHGGRYWNMRWKKSKNVQTGDFYFVTVR